MSSKLKSLLKPPNQEAPGFPIPELSVPLARRLLERIDHMRWYLNRYSLELNFRYQKLRVFDFLDLARSWGFDGAQIHVARGGPRIHLAAESDSYLKNLADQKNTRKLDLQIDISSTTKEDVEDAVRVARAMKIRVIRCYPRQGGTIAQIITQVAEQLKYAAELAERWNLKFVLEQHELLNGFEMVQILEEVKSNRVGILFDFANPITAHRNPLDDLYAMRDYIRGVHCKDVIIASDERRPAQLGVKFGQGDLNLSKLLFDLLILGEGDSLLEFFAIQEVVGYYSRSLRSASDTPGKIFPARPPSQTFIAKNMSAQEMRDRMMRERQDALEAFHSAKQRVNEINSLALDQLNRHLGDSDAAKGAEAALARKIEDAGRKLFGSEGYKRIWEIDSLTRSEWEDLNCSGFNYEAAKALLKETAEKKGRLIPPQAGS